MQIIKNKKIVQESWHFIEDDAPLIEGDISISLNRWQNEKLTLQARQGNLALRLNSSDELETIAADLNAFTEIELYFSAYTDGRGFSQAWLLRNRYQYTGDIKAIGHFMRDQLFYLQRVGVNVFKLEDNKNMLNALDLLNDFSVNYQQSTC